MARWLVSARRKARERGDQHADCLLNNAGPALSDGESSEEGPCDFAFVTNGQRDPGGRVAAGGRVSGGKKNI